MIIPELDREAVARYFPLTEIMKGIRSQADEAGFDVELFYLTDAGMTTNWLRAILIARAIKGVILARYASGVGTLDMDVTRMCAAMSVRGQA